MKNLFFVFFLLFGIQHIGTGQYEDIIFEDYTYVNNIKSVQFHLSTNPLGLPIIQLGGNQKINLTFDDMDNEQKDYSYQIIHCNKDWTPSELDVDQYIFGFNNEDITKSDFSRGTYVPYINYELQIPNDNLEFTASGNYLLIVYEGDNEDEDRIPVITRRFMIVEPLVGIEAIMHKPRDVMKLRTHQEFDLVINTGDFDITDPQNSITVTALQNYRWDTAIKDVPPKFIVGDKITIDNTGIFSFLAYKEFRFADFRSLEYVALGVSSIDLNDYGADVLLDLGKPMSRYHYRSEPDANGLFVIENKDRGSSNTQGDYAHVIFTLEMDKIDEDVYVMGAFTEWKPEEEFKMRYYEEKGVYVADILLKQGYYNFYYGILKNDILDPYPIEGSWYETENDYQILVYLHEPGDRYDRLIGTVQVDSFIK